jgi:hypothetical protein
VHPRIQFDLFLDYASNLALYPVFQKTSAKPSRRGLQSGANMIGVLFRPATPAGGNPTGVMVEAAYAHHDIPARFVNCDVALHASRMRCAAP